MSDVVGLGRALVRSLTTAEYHTDRHAHLCQPSLDDPLLTDDLAALFRLFPNAALRTLLDVMGKHKSLSPFPDQRAAAAHGTRKGADLRPHADAIARELLWWGSNDVLLDFGERVDWPGVVGAVAKNEGLKASVIAGRPAWQVGQALMKELLTQWEKLPPKQRAETMRKAGVGLDAARGGLAAVGGGAIAAVDLLATVGGPRLIALLAGRLAPLAVAGPAIPFIAPALTVLGTAWAAYDLAGPAFRVLRPAALLIAVTRQQLRDERMSAAFED